ncbi:C-type mannose receptor 2-like isoform X2 [Hemibagrus wyckioides]|uniref:C-type mannose receptor 2-like isoform X2 n=1 Tax=Hemibagrus wyckioides TaxID=337641 RepID=UPI00266D25E3|nr:C-type mannose receptor 2-like isoform X2 [Hemibagrus wyckioides]
MMNLFSFLCLIGFPFALSILDWTQVAPLLIKHLMTWPMAQNYCRTNHLDLYSITGPRDQVMLINEMNNHNEMVAVWTGLYNDLDNWYWSYNHLPLKNQSQWYFASGYPYNGYGLDVCGIINRNGQWETLSCYYTIPFICYDDLNKTQFLKLEVLSDASVLDPAVQSTILDLITQKLHENGMSVNTTVDWKVQSDGSIFHKKEQDKE